MQNQEPTSPQNKRRGRPRFEPTDEQRGMVRAYVECGYGEVDIARRIGVSEKTLRKHFAAQLEFAQMDFISAVVRSLGRMAVGAPAQFDKDGKQLRAEVVPDVAACCFILKTRGKNLGWSERLELTGENGAPVEIADATAKLAAILDRRAQRRGSDGGDSAAQPA